MSDLGRSQKDLKKFRKSDRGASALRITVLRIATDSASN